MGRLDDGAHQILSIWTVLIDLPQDIHSLSPMPDYDELAFLQ